MLTLGCELPLVVHDLLDNIFFVDAPAIVILHIDELWRNLMDHIILRLAIPVLAYIDLSASNKLSFNLSLTLGSFCITNCLYSSLE